MQIFKINNEASSEVALKKAIEVLKNGGVVMHPTDTCFGLTADVFSVDALQKVYLIKQMDEVKPVSMMVGSLDMALEYGDFTPIALELARKFWPGPLTLIVNRSALLPEGFNPQSSKVGIRLPDHNLSLALVAGVKRPLVTTSANRSGFKEVRSIEEYLEQMADSKFLPELALYEDSYTAKEASTIVDVSGEKPVIVRNGVISDELAKYMKQKGY